MTEKATQSNQKGTGAVRSAGRTLDILEVIAYAPTPPTSSEISAILKIPKSSLSLLLSTLVRRGYLEHLAPRGGYRLGLASERLAAQVTREVTSAGRMTPILRRLSAILNETSGYYECCGDSVECVASESGNQSLVFTMQIGERVRLYANSCGKAYLASLPEEELDQYLQYTTLRPYTPTTITNPTRLRRVLEEVRQSGIARSFGEYISGVVAVAVPLVEDVAFVGALNVAVPESRYSQRLDAEIVRHLRDASRDFARFGEARRASSR